MEANCSSKRRIAFIGTLDITSKDIEISKKVLLKIRVLSEGCLYKGMAFGYPQFIYNNEGVMNTRNTPKRR
jgi:hypothetical protein